MNYSSTAIEGTQALCKCRILGGMFSDDSTAARCAKCIEIAKTHAGRVVYDMLFGHIVGDVEIVEEAAATT